MKALAMVWLLRGALRTLRDLAIAELDIAITAITQLGTAHLLQLGLSWVRPPQDGAQSLAHTLVASTLPAVLFDYPTTPPRNTTAHTLHDATWTSEATSTTWSLAEELATRALPTILTWLATTAFRRRGR